MDGENAKFFKRTSDFTVTLTKLNFVSTDEIVIQNIKVTDVGNAFQISSSEPLLVTVNFKFTDAVIVKEGGLLGQLVDAALTAVSDFF